MTFFQLYESLQDESTHRDSASSERQGDSTRPATGPVSAGLFVDVAARLDARFNARPAAARQTAANDNRRDAGSEPGLDEIAAV